MGKFMNNLVQNNYSSTGVTGKERLYCFRANRKKKIHGKTVLQFIEADSKHKKLKFNFSYSDCRAIFKEFLDLIKEFRHPSRFLFYEMLTLLSKNRNWFI